jgi:chromosome segregation ATPase
MDHKKYHLIQSKLDEARNALKVWNDRRAEVSIELDSIFMEIEDYKKQVSGENADLSNQVSELKAALEKSETDYHQHFEVYTNDMQESKLANENLANQLRESVAQIESLRREMKKAESDHQARLAKTVSDAELKIAELQAQYKSQISRMTGELQSVQAEKKEITAKALQYENELRTFRGQMMNFLNMTGEVSLGSGKSARISVSDDAIKTESVKAEDATNHQDVRKSEHSPATVDEYLKRFGY